MKENKKYHKALTCSRVRILGNGMMAAGFLLLCAAVGIYGVGDGLSETVLIAGGSLLAAGFLTKLLGWRCPRCGAHLMLCVEKGSKDCPYCGKE